LDDIISDIPDGVTGATCRGWREPARAVARVSETVKQRRRYGDGAPYRKAKLRGVAAKMSEYLNEMIGYQVQGTAEWRRQKAEQFPQDTRNLRAAEELERLGDEINALTGSEIERQISDAHNSIADFPDNNASSDAWVNISEAVSYELRAIGFHAGYSTGQELLEWYRDLLSEKLHDLIEDAVPAPDLPTVKACQAHV
jgi:hypothetical protein